MKTKNICFLVPLVLLLAIFICACGREGSGSSDSTLSVYRPVKAEYRTGGELIRAEKVSLGENADPVQGAAYAISALSADDKLDSVLPDGVEIVSTEQNGKIAKVTMNAAYRAVCGMEKALVDYCIALTMCSIPKIDYVSIYVGSDLIESRLTAGDAVMKNTVVSSDEAGVRVYFPRLTGGLGYEYRTITVSGDSMPERLIMDELMAGPKSEQLSEALPKSTVPLSVYANGGICSISFAEGFLSDEALTDEDIQLSIYSIVNSLTGLADVDSVQILVEGREVSDIGGFDLSEPLSRKAGMSGFAVVE